MGSNAASTQPLRAPFSLEQYLEQHDLPSNAAIAGVDEAGRGPLAGPVVTAAVVFPADYKNSKFKDSKKLSAKKRELLFDEIIGEAQDWSIVAVGHHRIDQRNILRATLEGMRLAVSRVKSELILVDGNQRIPGIDPELRVAARATSNGAANLRQEAEQKLRRQEALIGGDDLIVQISAASILAKVWRDRLMRMLDAKYPGYGLGDHSGYPTKAHRQAITTLGPSPVHRRSFKLLG